MLKKVAVFVVILLVAILAMGFYANSQTRNEFDKNDMVKAQNTPSMGTSNTSIFKPEQITTPAVTPTATPKPIDIIEPDPIATATLSVVGDLMVHEWQLDNAYDKTTKTYDFYKSFRFIAPYLNKADYTIGNLETTLGESNFTGYPTFCTPDSFAQAIKDAGFDFVTTANNHANDRREAGILRTLNVLDKLGIDHTGTYRSKSERDTVFVKEINGISFAFLSYSYSTNGIPLTQGKDYLCNMLDEKLIENDIKAAKALNPDFIVVLPHMGNEYELYPKQVFKDWVKLMFNAGADIVLASHPHVQQTAEYVTVTDADGTERTCFVAYSLGNFISSQRTTPRDAGVIMNLAFEKPEGGKAKLVDVSYVSTWVKFTNDKGAYDITILPVGETVAQIQYGISAGLKPADNRRIAQISDEHENIFGDNIRRVDTSIYFTNSILGAKEGN